ncbi:MAG: 30S ribosomal protein S6 [Phycisphaerae bacterium]
MRQYEAMFLFDPTFGSSVENCEKEIQRLIERAGGEIVFCRKWDERRLAYRIAGRKRGVYMLVYFNAPPDRISGLERDAQLSEAILRVLVLTAEGVTRDMMESWVSRRGADEPAPQPGGRRHAAGGTKAARGAAEAHGADAKTGEPETVSEPVVASAGAPVADVAAAADAAPADAVAATPAQDGDTGAVASGGTTEAEDLAREETAT